MTAPLDVPGAAEEAQPDAIAQTGGARDRGRSLGQIAWMRLRKDKVAMTGGVFVVFMAVVALFAPLIVDLLGQPPNQWNQEAIDPVLGTPFGAMGGMSGE